MRQFITTALLALTMLMALAAPVSAATDPFAAVCSDGGADSTVCKSTGNGDPITTKTGIIHQITLIVAVIGGMAAVIVIVAAGIRYITSSGDSEQVAKAKRAIVYAAIGLIVIALGQAIITFVIGGI